MRTWDIFCKVIDNYGDIGVCWRLSADLASRGQRVRLWVDDATALEWMAPGALAGAFAGVRVIPWPQSCSAATLAGLDPAEVWVEGFGCEPDPAFVAHRFAPPAPGTMRRPPAPVWINLEYLSAETFAMRSHGLPSPIMHGPAKGQTRWFYYPGFSSATGGLVREAGLDIRQKNFDRAAWLARRGIDWQGQRVVSLFCYEPTALGGLLEQCRSGHEPTLLLVTAGRAAAAVRGLLPRVKSATGNPDMYTCGSLTAVFLPSLTQADFDHLLWASDINFVRGEDSLVRALWAGCPFVWQIYPQDGDAHHAKLDALLNALEAPPSWRRFHRAWNGIGAGPLPALDPGLWGDAVRRARSQLASQADLGTRLLQFVDKLSQGRKTARKDS